VREAAAAAVAKTVAIIMVGRVRESVCAWGMCESMAFLEPIAA